MKAVSTVWNHHTGMDKIIRTTSATYDQLGRFPCLIVLDDLPSDQQSREVVTGKQCPYCGGKTEYIDTELIYGRSYGMAYRCKPCDSYCGTHKGTDRCLGRLANKELRKWKMKAHQKFDDLWRMSKREDRRKNAYRWMQEVMNLRRSRAHVGMFNVHQCKELIRHCDELVESLKNKK